MSRWTLTLIVPVDNLLKKSLSNKYKTYVSSLIYWTFGEFEIRNLNVLHGGKKILSFREDLTIG